MDIWHGPKCFFKDLKYIESIEIFQIYWDIKITRFEEGLTQILKNNFLKYSSDVNHARLVLNWSIGMS